MYAIWQQINKVHMKCPRLFALDHRKVKSKVIRPLAGNYARMIQTMRVIDINLSAFKCQK